jgi:hypothetical protein
MRGYAPHRRCTAVEQYLEDGHGLEQSRHLLRRRQVVRHLAVVNADVQLHACTDAMKTWQPHNQSPTPFQKLRKGIEL